LPEHCPYITYRGVATSAAESPKEKKYAAFSPAHIFAQVAIETLGVWGPGASDLISTILVLALCIVLLNELSADDIVACTASDFNDLFPPSMFGSKKYSVYS